MICRYRFKYFPLNYSFNYNNRNNISNVIYVYNLNL